MFADPRTYLFFLANALLLFLVLLVNNTLSSLSVYLFLCGPMIVLPALYQRYPALLLTVALTGAWLDAALKAPFGFFPVTMALAATLLFMFRIRFRAEHNYHPLILAHVLNPVLFLVLLAVMAPDPVLDFDYWVRGFTDLFFSQLVLVAVGPWFFNLVRLCFRLFKVDPEPADLPMA